MEAEKVFEGLSSTAASEVHDTVASWSYAEAILPVQRGSNQSINQMLANERWCGDVFLIKFGTENKMIGRWKDGTTDQKCVWKREKM